MSNVPPPHPSGYQPGEGEGFEYIDVVVSPSWGYQSVAVTGRYRFDSPRSLTEVVPVFDDVYQALEEEAARRVDQLLELRKEREQAQRGTPASAPERVTVSADDLVAGPRSGGGLLKYIPGDLLPKQQLEQDAKATVVEATGLPSDELIAFDNRDRLMQNQAQTGPVTVKAKRDSPLSLVMGERDTVAWVGFTDQGGLAAKVSKEGKGAAAAVTAGDSTGGAQ